MGTDSSSRAWPPTLVVVHRKERRDKCSVEPLRGRPDFSFVNYPTARIVPTEGYVRLALEGPMLEPADAHLGLLILDATWRLAEKMTRDYGHVPPRRLPSWKTAYPRVSKLSEDPSQGLATIEAIYLAYHILGRETAGLLAEYRWRDEFLRLNGIRSGEDTSFA